VRLKDYYKILGLSPDAQLTEIKKSYRRLAMQYHPDKNEENKIAAAHFKEIKEAYEILSDPNKREKYHQQRWYSQALGRRFANGVPITPDSVLKECLFLDQYVCTLDKFRIDYEGLYLYIIQIPSYNTIDSLKLFNDSEANHSIVNALLRSTSDLPYEFALKLSERLMLLAENDEDMIASINRYQDTKKRQNNKEKLKCNS
jgi:molecular chaperone DnaJ